MLDTAATTMTRDGDMRMSQGGSNPRFHELTETERRWIRKAIRLIQTFREQEPDLPTSYADAFLQVVIEPGRGPSYYAEKLHTIQAVTSRLLLRIGVVPSGQEQKTGLGWVDRQNSPTSLRSQEYFLTRNKGMPLLRRILEIGED